MKQLVIAVLLAALLSLSYRLVGTFTAEAGNAPAPPSPKHEPSPAHEAKPPIQPAAVRVDQSCAECSGGEEASRPSRTVVRAVAKPLLGVRPTDLAVARTPPPPAPLERLMVGPEGIAYRKVGAPPSTVSALRTTPPPDDEPLVQAPPPAPVSEPVTPVVRNDKPLSPEPVVEASPVLVPVRGKMIGPDGIEYRPVSRGH
jgi:hypothetical protein